jgi:hypothetical protein
MVSGGAGFAQPAPLVFKRVEIEVRGLAAPRVIIGSGWRIQTERRG